MALSLTDRQAKTVAAAITILSVVVILVAVGAFFWLVSWFLRSFSVVFLPLAVGGIAALVCRPYYDWLRQRLRLPGAVALVAILLSWLVPVGAFLWFFGAIAVEQLVGLVEQLPDWWAQFQVFVKER